MPWLLVAQRERDKCVSGSNSQEVTFTKDRAEAIRFASQDEACIWIARTEVRRAAALCLMRDGPNDAHPRCGHVGHYRPRARS